MIPHSENENSKLSSIYIKARLILFFLKASFATLKKKCRMMKNYLEGKLHESH